MNETRLVSERRDRWANVFGADLPLPATEQWGRREATGPPSDAEIDAAVARLYTAVDAGTEAQENFALFVAKVKKEAKSIRDAVDNYRVSATYQVLALAAGANHVCGKCGHLCTTKAKSKRPGGWADVISPGIDTSCTTRHFNERKSHNLIVQYNLHLARRLLFKNSAGKAVCVVCFKTFNTADELVKHVLSEHTPEDKFKLGLRLLHVDGFLIVENVVQKLRGLMSHRPAKVSSCLC